MTNEEVKQFFIDNGAYDDFEITNYPIFEIIVVVNNQALSKALRVGSFPLLPNVRYFISSQLNDLNKKYYIYNDYETDFKTTTYIRYTSIDCPDRLMKYRLNKIKKIKSKINDKQIRTNRFLYSY
jgi:hypothetical protein